MYVCTCVCVHVNVCACLSVCVCIYWSLWGGQRIISTGGPQMLSAIFF